MNIQIFTKPKSFDCKKAERYFKERGIPFQLIDLSKKAMSRGELASVKKAVGGLKPLLDEKCREYEANFIAYLSEESAVEEKLLEHPLILAAPIVRNGQKATVGFQPDLWKTWE